MTVVSSFAIRLAPYRRLNTEIAPSRGEELDAEDLLPKTEWLEKHIVHERELYFGRSANKPGEKSGLTRWRKAASLEASFDRERSMLLLVQWLLALEVLLLLLSRLI
jgi:hypothetical protein